MFSWLRSAAKPAQAPKTAARPEPESGPSQAALEAKRRALGVEDALREIPGVTAPMLVALGENGIKTLEELAGWFDPMCDTSTTHAGVLAGFGLSREEFGSMLIKALVKAGWIDEAAA